MLDDVVLLIRAVLVDVGPGADEQRHRVLHLNQLLRVARIDVALGQVDGLLEALAYILHIAPVLCAGVHPVAEPWRRRGDDTLDTEIVFHGGMVDGLDSAQAVAPYADALIAGLLSEIDPCFPVGAGAIDDLVRGAELDALAIHGRLADGVVTSIVDAYGSAPVLGKPRAPVLERAGSVEVTRYTVVQDHDVHRKLRFTGRCGLQPGAVQAYAIFGAYIH